MKKIMIMLLMIVCLTSCSTNDVIPTQSIENEAGEALNEAVQVEDNATMDHEELSTTEIADVTEALNTEAMIDEMISNMTTEEKIGQLFIVDFYTFNNYNDTTYMSDSLYDRFQSYPVGGVIYFGSNVVDREQVINFNTDLQNSVDIPMFIAVDEEGGIVRRLGSNPLMGMSQTLTAAVIGETLDYDIAYNQGAIIGSEIRALGFNMDFAPVADVNTNPDNPVIGDRSFGNDPEVVAGMVASTVNGLQDENVAAIAKHFPGHGDTSFDTHTEDVYVEHDMERLEEIELVPFARAIDENVMGIMTAHIILENMTGTDLPATLSYDILTGLLREDMGYEGLIITDAFTMNAISDRYSSGEASVMAIEAGVDIILMPENFDEAYIGVLEAVNKGSISVERLDESVKRILLTKYKLELFE